jgi:hypothetical protein
VCADCRLLITWCCQNYSILRFDTAARIRAVASNSVPVAIGSRRIFAVPLDLAYRRCHGVCPLCGNSRNQVYFAWLLATGWPSAAMAFRVGAPPLTLSANALYVGQVVTWAAAKLPH